MVILIKIEVIFNFFHYLYIKKQYQNANNFMHYDSFNK